MNSVSSYIPQIHSITLTDWLQKLGEKAFLAWLQFHSWKTDQAHDDQPYSLCFSINKLVKKLSIGKSTFYNKILKPLLRYGLIDLQPTESANRETHLLVYAFPQNSPEKACLPLIPLSEPNDEWEGKLSIKEASSAPVSKEPLNEPTLTYSENTTRMKKDSNLPPSNPKEDSMIDSLPVELQLPIQSDPQLLERLASIVEAHQKCCTHPQYTHQAFLEKLTTCVKYPHDKRHFAAYLLKAILNEWNKPKRPAPPSVKPSKPCPNDVPVWIWEQQERQKLGIAKESIPLQPDQQAEINRLLKELGEI